MGIFSKFENRMEDTFEGAAGKMSKAPISPVQIAKKAEKQMRRETMVGAGREYAPTLYTVLVNPDDDARLFGYYPTLAGETETYLSAKAMQEGLVMDGDPLVRFVVDDGLRHGKFDVIAELVAAPIVAQLRDEEMQRYGIAPHPNYAQPQAYQQPQQGYPAQNQQAGDAWGNGYAAYVQPEPQPAPPQRKPPLPYVPEEEIDRSIDYGEYTFNSEDFEDYRDKAIQSGEFNDEDGFAYPQAYNESLQAETQVPEEPMQPANTAAFVGGAQPVPNQNAVRARIVDLAYQRSYDLAGTLVTMGRESHNDIVVQDINASRKHAELRLNAQGIWTITDLKSMNGTLVNGVSIASHPLYPGDIVTIGKTDFQFTIA
ncbi:MAG: FHA domain-containing protein [Eggerthellaceae bacterium]|nr:FHA domain-containing protein [Eggerthellaceae bacterium]